MSRSRISWGQVIAYGLGGIVPIALFNIAGQLIGLVGNISLGLNALALGLITNFVPRLWDAFSDPVMGYLTDNTRSRFGRRRPYILVGGIGVALSFAAMWWVPTGNWIRGWFPSDTSYAWFQLLYILGGVLVFYTACTVFEIPHGALGMELSGDYHERTKLFSSKSFMGNFFAMGTPWLIKLATLTQFSGVGGSLADGMRYVSLTVAMVLVPLSIWWFWVLKEPPLKHVASSDDRVELGDSIDADATAQARPLKKGFWANMATTCTNRTFLRLVAIVFILAMGFNFVSIFNYYITIFYLYGGDSRMAANLLGINGTVWAITGLAAVLPLNIISRHWGKNRTLALAILLMFFAQLSKIVCYNPTYPYLTIFPTILLSSGMLMFFTLGNSMVADICDEDELNTGSRSEGSYYSVFWWFIKLGSAFAGIVMGALLVLTQFDEKQNVTADSVRGSLEIIIDTAEKQRSGETGTDDEWKILSREKINAARKTLTTLEEKWNATAFRVTPNIAEQRAQLQSVMDQIRLGLAALEEDIEIGPAQVATQAGEILDVSRELGQQSETALWRLRLFEIGLPMLLCLVSFVLTMNYPLTEKRCYEIKAALEAREGAA